ncbi:MAG: F420-nonreducing hydrogenase [Desulfobacterales bacterium]|nr:F420-nonreducing hydrogenase [Desulfobacterales bacterium]
MTKPKVAFYWCASCGGCEEAVINLDEDLLKVMDAVDIILWPAFFDFKSKDIEALEDGDIAVSFINGAVRMGEQEEMAKLLRQKSQIIVAFGSCAHMGGIPGLGNLYTRDTIFQRVYTEVQTVENPEGITPQERTAVDIGELTLPEFYDTVKTLDQVIPVDYYLPGCPPPPDLIMNAVNAILEGELPEKGAVLAPDKPLCDTCPRAEERREGVSIQEIKRPHEIKLSPWKCFLEQGIICLGSVTRSGCGERCIKANMPCMGCMGPAKGTVDQGAKALSIIASILGLEEEEGMTERDVNKLLDGIVDPAGTFYRFSLPGSLLARRRTE